MGGGAKPHAKAEGPTPCQGSWRGMGVGEGFRVHGDFALHGLRFPWGGSPSMGGFAFAWAASSNMGREASHRGGSAPFDNLMSNSTKRNKVFGKNAFQIPSLEFVQSQMLINHNPTPAMYACSNKYDVG